MQNVESYFILDYITKKISVAEPEIPLYTIHNSIVTTPEHVDYVESKLRGKLFYFFGVGLKIEREFVVQEILTLAELRNSFDT